MSKSFAILLSTLVLTAAPGPLSANTDVEGTEAGPGPELAEKADLSLATSTMYLKAAQRMIEGSNDEQAAQLLDKALELSFQGSKFHGAGQYGTAVEAFEGSTHMVVSALSLVRNEEASKKTDAEAVAASRLREEQDRKLTIIKRKTEEAECFTQSAEELLAEKGDFEGSSEAEALVSEAKVLLASANTRLESKSYDGAIQHLERAYYLAVKSIKITKLGEFIAFPRPNPNNEAAVLTYEIQRNNIYAKIARQMIRGADTEALKLYKKASKERKSALRTRNRRDTKALIANLRNSTSKYESAIRLKVKDAPVHVVTY